MKFTCNAKNCGWEIAISVVKEESKQIILLGNFAQNFIIPKGKMYDPRVVWYMSEDQILKG